MGLLSADVKRQIRDVVVENYSPAEGVLELAAGLDVELIVLGIRPGGTFLRAETHSSPSITRQIIMSAICPVLTVRG
jgi:nucleotide-binding universal stress UspA family protein